MERLLTAICECTLKNGILGESSEIRMFKRYTETWNKLHCGAESEISGDFPVIYRMELVWGEIREGFPTMQSKIPHF